MKIKTSKLTGAALDWAVAKCEGRCTDMLPLWGEEPDGESFWVLEGNTECMYSTNWNAGGPIIDRKKIRFDDLPDNGIRAFIRRPVGRSGMLIMDCWDEGITPLIAAMRCLVASTLGDEVEVPADLVNKD